MKIYTTKRFEFIFWTCLDCRWLEETGFLMIRFFPPEFYFQFRQTNRYYRWWFRLGYFEVRRFAFDVRPTARPNLVNTSKYGGLMER
jgi:hypothetical protein